jgi:hypothetical protein
MGAATSKEGRCSQQLDLDPADLDSRSNQPLYKFERNVESTYPPDLTI